MDDHEDLETLGEQLYAIIYPKHKDKAGKITGEEVHAGYFVKLIFAKSKWSYLLNYNIKPMLILSMCNRHVVGATSACPQSDAAG